MRGAVQLSLALLALVASSGCGNNIFEELEAKDPPEDAVIALERDDPDRAIAILEAALQGDPGDPQMLSVLSAAYAQRAGVEPLTVAKSMTEQDVEAGDSSDPGLVSLFGVMPKATTSSLTDIDRAVQIIANEIPADQRMPGDTFKLAIYQTASMVMHMKALDLNGDGQLSIDEVGGLSDQSARGIAGQLAAAQAILAASGDDDSISQKAAEALGKYQEQIDAAPGSTPEEKLRNYLAQNAVPH